MPNLSPKPTLDLRGLLGSNRRGNFNLPEFVPLPPAKGVEFYSGLKRGKLNQLILPCPENGGRPPVKSVSLRQRGCLKGKRLIHLRSLLDYLASRLVLEEAQRPEAEQLRLPKATP